MNLLAYLKKFFSRIHYLVFVLQRIRRHPLNSNHKFLSIINFFCWHIGKRLLRKEIIVPWVDDCKFIMGNDDIQFRWNIYIGLFEYEDMLFFLHALRPENIFVDVGANVGAYTILSSKVVNAKSVAFEPLPETFERLKNNINVNRIADRVVIKNLGVADKIGSVYFTNNRGVENKVNLTNKRGSDTTNVSVTTLDSELSENNDLFLKIDVEGYELNVIEGAKNILSSKRFLALIIEFSGIGEEFGYSNDMLHKKLTLFNLIPIKYDPLTRQIIKLNDYNKKSLNTIYVKDIKKIQKLCLSAPKRTIHTAHNILI